MTDNLHKPLTDEWAKLRIMEASRHGRGGSSVMWHLVRPHVEKLRADKEGAELKLSTAFGLLSEHVNGMHAEWCAAEVPPGPPRGVCDCGKDFLDG